MNAFQMEEENSVDQGKDGETIVSEDGTIL
jgi:hypothetical protein